MESWIAIRVSLVGIFLGVAMYVVNYNDLIVLPHYNPKMVLIQGSEIL